jgi:hypothetical protein
MLPHALFIPAQDASSKVNGAAHVLASVGRRCTLTTAGGLTSASCGDTAMKSTLLFFLAITFPGSAQAYLASYSGYDTKHCAYVSFEVTNLDSSGEAAVHGYSQPVEGRGNATPFEGRLSIEDSVWTFLPEPAFLLAGSTYRKIARGMLECTGGCSRHGIKYIFELSLEDMTDTPLYKQHVKQVRALCPSIFT